MKCGLHQRHADKETNRVSQAGNVPPLGVFFETKRRRHQCRRQRLKFSSRLRVTTTSGAMDASGGFTSPRSTMAGAKNASDSPLERPTLQKHTDDATLRCASGQPSTAASSAASTKRLPVCDNARHELQHPVSEVSAPPQGRNQRHQHDTGRGKPQHRRTDR
jgi:hypothetical protein